MSDLSTRTLLDPVLLAIALIRAAPGWLTLLGPALMLLCPLKVTGMPPIEANAVASRGDADRARQRTTHPFFPGPPRPDPQGTDR